jgi:general secretion pathway protein D
MKIRSLLAITCLALPLLAAAEGPSSGAAPPGYDGIELADVIAAYAKRSGKKFIIDPRVRQQVSLAGIDPMKLSYEQLLAVISVHMFATYTDGDFIVVVPDANARQLPGPIYTNTKFKALDDEIVTLVMTPKNACAGQLVPVLRPLLPQAAHMAPAIGSNTLIINDRALNVHRIAELVELLDRATPAGHGCDDPAKKGG